MMALYTIADRLKLWRKFRVNQTATIVTAVTAAELVVVILMAVTLCRIAFSTIGYLRVASFISMSLSAAKVTAELIVECTAPAGGASIWRGVEVVFTTTSSSPLWSAYWHSLHQPFCL